MIRAVLILTAVLKLAAASSVAIPKINKDLEGNKINIDVEVDIDTGKAALDASNGAPAPAPADAPGPTCAEEGESCKDSTCCEGLACRDLLIPNLRFVCLIWPPKNPITRRPTPSPALPIPEQKNAGYRKLIKRKPGGWQRPWLGHVGR